MHLELHTFPAWTYVVSREMWETKNTSDPYLQSPAGCDHDCCNDGAGAYRQLLCGIIRKLPIEKILLNLRNKKSNKLLLALEQVIAKLCKTSFCKTLLILKNKCKTAREVFAIPCDTHTCETCETWFVKHAKHCETLIAKIAKVGKLSISVKLWSKITKQYLYNSTFTTGTKPWRPC